MAKSAAERKRISRAQKAEALKMAPDQSMAYLRRPFHEFLNRHAPGYDENLDAVGVHISGTPLTEAVQAFDSEYQPENQDDPHWVGMTTALGRAEAIAGVLLDAAAELNELINTYKLGEIDARIAEIEQADLSDPAIKAQALADIVQLNQIRTRLDKSFRRSFREINVKGSFST